MQKILFVATDEVFDTPAKIEAAWRDDELYEAIHDAERDVRGGDYDAELPPPLSRHYESKIVAAKMLDGSYLAWVYWYGGGKHGEPESIPWIEDAFEVEAKSVTVTKLVFTKVE